MCVPSYWYKQLRARDEFNDVRDPSYRLTESDALLFDAGSTVSRYDHLVVL